MPVVMVGWFDFGGEVVGWGLEELDHVCNK